jgi:hypothetical protein
MAKQPENNPERGSGKAAGDERLKRRGDNVGQSGRWTKGDPGADRYGNEERHHSTDHAPGTPDEPPQRTPNADTSNASPYEGRFASPGEAGEEHGDDKADYPAGSYAQAGGTAGANQPVHPGDGRWEDAGGAGYGEQYGTGRDPDKRPATGRKSS